MTKLYVFATEPQSWNGAPYVCTEEDGKVIGQHYCSSDVWARGDLGVEHTLTESHYKSQRAALEEMYPKGFTIKFIEYDSPLGRELRSKLKYPEAEL